MTTPKLVVTVTPQLGNQNRHLLEINATREGLEKLISLCDKTKTTDEVVWTAGNLILILRLAGDTEEETPPNTSKLMVN